MRDYETQRSLMPARLDPRHLEVVVRHHRDALHRSEPDITATERFLRIVPLKDLFAVDLYFDMTAALQNSNVMSHIGASTSQARTRGDFLETRIPSQPIRQTLSFVVPAPVRVRVVRNRAAVVGLVIASSRRQRQIEERSSI